MGVVYLAYDPGLDRHCTVKLLNAQFAPPAEALRNEARTLAKLKHPNIVRVIRFGVTTDKWHLPYFVMEEAHGQSLHKVLLQARLQVKEKSAPLLGMTEALDIAVELFEALAYAHGCGVIHRDIKPDNIIIQREGIITTAKLIDFGLATQAYDGMVVGTPLYASPEQLTGQVVSAKTDLYSAGQTLYEMLSGEAAFNGVKGMAALMEAHMKLAPCPIEERVSNVPEDFAKLVMRLIEKSPSSRPRSAHEVVLELRTIRKEYHTRYSQSEIHLATDPGRANDALDAPLPVPTRVHDGRTQPVRDAAELKKTKDVFGRKTLDLRASTEVDGEFAWLDEIKQANRAKLMDSEIVTRSLRPVTLATPDTVYLDIEGAVHLAEDIVFTQKAERKESRRRFREWASIFGWIALLVWLLVFIGFMLIQLKN
jgi:serine/threonine protein kinase